MSSIEYKIIGRDASRSGASKANTPRLPAKVSDLPIRCVRRTVLFMIASLIWASCGQAGDLATFAEESTGPPTLEKFMAKWNEAAVTEGRTDLVVDLATTDGERSTFGFQLPLGTITDGQGSAVLIDATYTNTQVPRFAVVVVTAAELWPSDWTACRCFFEPSSGPESAGTGPRLSWKWPTKPR